MIFKQNLDFRSFIVTVAVSISAMYLTYNVTTILLDKYVNLDFNQQGLAIDDN